jgi:hypothetical protein
MLGHSIVSQGFMEPEGSILNKFFFYGEGLTPRSTPKLEDHPLLSVHVCLFTIFAATFHSWRPFLLPQPEDAPCCGDRDPT